MFSQIFGLFSIKSSQVGRGLQFGESKFASIFSRKDSTDKFPLWSEAPSIHKVSVRAKWVSELSTISELSTGLCQRSSQLNCCYKFRFNKEWFITLKESIRIWKSASGRWICFLAWCLLPLPKLAVAINGFVLGGRTAREWCKQDFLVMFLDFSVIFFGFLCDFFGFLCEFWTKSTRPEGH